MILTLRALLGSVFARIGGWLALAVGALAFLKYRDISARKQGRAEAETATRDATLRKREEMAAVPRPGGDELTKSLRDGKF